MPDLIPVFFDLETTGLNPMQQKWWDNYDQDAQVVCVGVGTLSNWQDDGKDTVYDVRVFSSNSEYELMEEVRSEMRREIQSLKGEFDNPEVMVVGWNSRRFDHPYWGARAARLRQDPYPFGYRFKRLDCMRAMKKSRGRYMKQDDLAEEIGVKSEDSITGKDVPDLFKQGRMEPIKKHCYTDLEDLIEVFLHFEDTMLGEYRNHYGGDGRYTSVDEIEWK